MVQNQDSPQDCIALLHETELPTLELLCILRILRRAHEAMGHTLWKAACTCLIGFRFAPRPIVANGIARSCGHTCIPGVPPGIYTSVLPHDLGALTEGSPARH